MVIVFCIINELKADFINTDEIASLEDRIKTWFNDFLDMLKSHDVTSYIQGEKWLRTKKTTID